MKFARVVAAAVGGVAFGLGMATVVAPDALGVDADAAVALAGNDYLFALAFAGLGLAVVVAVVALRAVGGVDQAVPPDPERIPTGEPPGAAFDRVVAGRGGLRTRLDPDEQERVRRRLREAAVRAEMRTAGTTREAAEAAVDRGAWTDDSTAAEFLGDGGGPTARWAELFGTLVGDSPFQRRARRSARAVETAAGDVAAGRGAR